MKVPLFVGPSHTSQSIIADSQRTMNWIPEPLEQQSSKAQVALYPTPGLGVAKATFDEAPGRGITEVRNRIFTVQGDKVYEVTEAYATLAVNAVPVPPATVGLPFSLAVDGNPATFSNNGEGLQVFVTSGGNGYIVDLSVDPPTIQLVDTIGPATVGDHLDSFFIVLDTTTSTLRISALSDGTSWDSADFVTRSDASDPWKAMISQGGEIWVIGSRTGGVFFNSGAPDFPFELRTESFFEIGCLATFSLARFDNSVAWLGASEQGFGAVYRASGYTPVRISTHPVEEAIRGYTNPTDAIGWSYEDRGHSFYVLDFPTDGETWVYDAGTQLWHERGKWDTVSGEWQNYRARFHALGFNNRHLVCDRLVGAVYELGSTVYTDAGGDPLRRLRRTSHISNENKQIVIDDLEVELERGVGLAESLSGSNPSLTLRYSKDGGQTWDNQRFLRFGRSGEYRARAIARRLGLGRDWVFEVSSFAPVPLRIVDGYFTGRPGQH